jgi:hypothetical protein
MGQIVILKFKSGVEVIGELLKTDHDGEKFVLKDVFNINIKMLDPVTPSVSLVRFTMFAKSSEITFLTQDLLVNPLVPRESFVRYYEKACKHFEENIAPSLDEQSNAIAEMGTLTKDELFSELLKRFPVDKDSMQ